MRNQREKEYWEENFGAKLNSNELYFNWYDEIRFKFFSSFRAKGYSLEIGAGRGCFSQKAHIDVAVDTSHAALLKLRTRYQCLAVVADASRLPFKARSFQSIYINDVFHHLKAQGLLEKACEEIRRALHTNGLLFVSDRAPSLYNSVLLKINYCSRVIFSLLARNKSIRFSGSLDEPAMNNTDYRIIYRGMKVLSKQEWKNCFVFWCYGLQQFLNIILTEKMRQKCARKFILTLNKMEGKIHKFFKTDVCLVLQRDIKDGYS